MSSKNARFASSGEKTQRAAIINNYTDGVHLESNLAIDDQLADHEVLVQVVSTSVNPIDWVTSKGYLQHAPFMAGATFPMILGFDLSGKISKVGSKVEKFKVGDEVYGLGESYSNGTFCEYYKLLESSIVKKPSKLSWNEAAAIPLASLTAYQGILECGNLKAGQSILIIGGASGVGLFGIQIAKSSGAKVTTTCSGANIDWVKDLGADVVIDYKKDDFARVLAGQKFDVVFDAAGGAEDREKGYDIVKPDGYFVTTRPEYKEPQGRANTGKIQFKTFVCSFQKGYALDEINKWIEAGTFKVKIDSVLPFDQVQDALQKSQGGKLSGKIVMEMTKM